MKHCIKIAVLLFLFSTSGYSQDCDIENLVFEGAGIRGIAYAGVIEELEKHDKLENVKKVGGTSAGAITALLVSLGYSSKEIADIISSTKFRKFNDGRFMFIGGLLRMKNLFGWYRGDRFSEWTAKIIENKTGNSEITFEELSTRGYKDLYITATCLNQQKLIILSKENYPRMKVRDAVRISMSIPLYFKAVFIDSTGTAFRKPGKRKNLDIMVDGGIVGNFPIFMFDKTDSINKEHRIPNYKTVGVRIDSDLQIHSDTLSRELIPMEIHNFNDYVSALYIFTIENLNRNELTDDDWSRTISVSSVGISPRIMKLSNEQKEKLIKSGRDFTSGYIKNNCTTQ
jgi:NTE family protein